MIGEDVLYQSATELGRQIRAHKLSPVELAEAYLARIHRIAPKLNAFETVTDDLALAQARAAEAELSRGKVRGPLHGVPYGAKDLFATIGTRTTWGAVPLKEQVFDYDATVVQRLRDAGAVLLGKLAMVELAGGLGYRWADASVSGPGRNPWNTSRWTGGSSSGSGAAVAAGLVGFALGTETWGSILCPSAFCGLTGLRPTYGRVPRTGAMACAYTFDKVGPIARSAEDCRTIIEIIAGHDPADASSADQPTSMPRNRRPLSKLRAALVPMDFKVKGAEIEVKEAFDRAVGELRGIGLHMDDAKFPEFPASEVAGMLITAEAVSQFENLYKDGRVKRLKDVYAPWQPEINAAVTGPDIVKAWRMRRVLQEKVADWYGTYDVVVTPNFLSVAPPIDKDLYETLPYSDPAGAIGNACGLPSLALPIGFGRDHMPASLQVMGAPWDESLLLDIGETYQKRTSWHREHPPIG